MPSVFRGCSGREPTEKSSDEARRGDERCQDHPYVLEIPDYDAAIIFPHEETAWRDGGIYHESGAGALWTPADRPIGGSEVGSIQGQLNYDAPSLTIGEEKVWRILVQCQGRGAAIQAVDLAQMTVINERRVRQIIKHLVEEHGILIGSSISKPYGYFVPVSTEEVEAVTKQLYHRLVSLAVRISRIKRISVEDVLGQMRLEV